MVELLSCAPESASVLFLTKQFCQQDENLNKLTDTCLLQRLNPDFN